MEKNSRKGLKRSAMFGTCLAALLVLFAAVPVQAQQTTVSLDTPEMVEGSTVYATVNIDNVEDLDAGQLDLLFNPDVLNVVSVENGNIGETEIPVQWRVVDSTTVRVIFNLEGVTGVSGSGELARIGFELVGDGEGGLRISDGLLGDTEAKSIDTDWGITEAVDAQVATPGFEAIFALAGLTAGICLARFGKERW
ncbi:cohesin domain-containing protein [Methanosarcina sp. Mfa9]|uniref:cohesin domain-containing protein n=1 Tax=Methanosarcina sp. Mfa9 TaxID=3439063 RepID=UPI003F840082